MNVLLLLWLGGEEVLESFLVVQPGHLNPGSHIGGCCSTLVVGQLLVLLGILGRVALSIGLRTAAVGATQAGGSLLLGIDAQAAECGLAGAIGAGARGDHHGGALGQPKLRLIGAAHLQHGTLFGRIIGRTLELKLHGGLGLLLQSTGDCELLGIGLLCTVCISLILLSFLSFPRL